MRASAWTVAAVVAPDDVPPTITVCILCGHSYPYQRETRGCDECGRDDVTRLYSLVP